MGIFDFFSNKSKPSPEAQALVNEMSALAFPRDEIQIEEEAGPGWNTFGATTAIVLDTIVGKIGDVRVS